MSLMRRLHYMQSESKHCHGARYGYNLEEFRNVAMTELASHAKDKGLDMDCVKFWCDLMGQVDTGHLQYDKFYENSEYMERQYAIAELYLNIISGTPAHKARNLAGENRGYQMTYMVTC
jgi:hypothetical protein